MNYIKCPHCSGDVPITKQVQKVVMRFFARKPRPGGGNAGNGERRREICRKAAAASVLKRWGKVVGETPTKNQLQDKEAGAVEQSENKNLEIGQAGVENLVSGEKSV